MRRALVLTIALIVAATMLAACTSSPSGPSSPSPPSLASLPRGTLSMAGGNAVLSVWIAETQAARERGLMWVSSLPEDQGMVFLFPQPDACVFWMKNTLIPLSIAFWDEQGRIVDILDMQPCETDQCPYSAPKTPCVGAVEANQGYFASHGIAIGDTVELSR